MEAIHKRKQGESRKDSLQRLMDAYDEETKSSLEDREVAAELVVQFVAGTDTTSASLTWILYSLLQNPTYMKKLQAELDEAIPDIDTYVTHSMVKDLPYLNAVCNEGLRLYPVASGDAHRVTPPEGAVICGKFIPGGTTIIPQTYAIHRLTTYWDKPYEFIPERWIAAPEQVNRMKQNFMPFSVGLRVALAVMVRRFNFTFVPGANMTPSHRFIVRPHDGRLDVTVQKRTS
ncbi:cytochrome P450 [Syncephalis plumigaleata]|nr:cytochrome P450 [Syncephalis plumigaleata]